MSVIRSCAKDAPGAMPRGKAGSEHEFYVCETYKNLVVDKWERNGYNESDFYCAVWDPEEKTFKEFEYATTRFWTYANSAEVDAPPELIEKYKEWAYQQVLKKRWRRLRNRAKSLREKKIDLHLAVRLVGAELPETQEKVAIQLLRTKKFRNDFRRSCRKQLEIWLLSSDYRAKYKYPFSYKQLNSLTRHLY